MAFAVYDHCATITLPCTKAGPGIEPRLAVYGIIFNAVTILILAEDKGIEPSTFRLATAFETVCMPYTLSSMYNFGALGGIRTHKSRTSQARSCSILHLPQGHV